jgi:hypothetical protein
MYADPDFAAGLANYQEFAAGFARRCRERRNTEEAQREELAELTKPALPSAAGVCKSNGAGAGLVYKDRDNAHVAGDSSAVERALPARRASAESGSDMAWQDWVEERIEQHLEPLNEVIGQAMAEWVGQRLDPLERELALLRHEFICLREDVALAKSLHELREEVATARKQIPKVPAIEARLGAEQTRLVAEQDRLQRELDVTKDKLANLRVEQGLDRHSISQLEKAASKTTASIEMETSVARFALRNIHPDAAKMLREFASQVVDAEDGGAIWGRCLTAGTA